MRKKVTVSLQDEELKLIDERVNELNLTRSAYLMALVLRDTKRNGNEFKRTTDFIKKEAYKN